MKLAVKKKLWELDAKQREVYSKWSALLNFGLSLYTKLGSFDDSVGKTKMGQGKVHFCTEIESEKTGFIYHAFVN